MLLLPSGLPNAAMVFWAPVVVGRPRCCAVSSVDLSWQVGTSVLWVDHQGLGDTMYQAGMWDTCRRWERTKCAVSSRVWHTSSLHVQYGEHSKLDRYSPAGCCVLSGCTHLDVNAGVQSDHTLG